MDKTEYRRLLDVANYYGMAVKTICMILHKAGYFHKNNTPLEKAMEEGYFQMTKTFFTVSSGEVRCTRPCVHITDKGFELIDRLVSEKKKKSVERNKPITGREIDPRLYRKLNTLWGQRHSI
jgi:phage antirepressor YoqD-like protein